LGVLFDGTVFGFITFALCAFLPKEQDCVFPSFQFSCVLICLAGEVTDRCC